MAKFKSNTTPLIDVNKATRKQLELFIRSKGKKANQRIVELGQSKFKESSKALGYIERNAYQNKRYYSTSKSGNNKFTTSIRGLTKDLTKQQSMVALRKQASEIDKFLRAKSSTVTGIKEQFKKATKTLSEHYNYDFKPEEIGELFKVYDETGLLDKFGSDQVIETYKKYIDNISITDLVNVIEKSNGLTTNDVDVDIKRRILTKRYYGQISNNELEEIIRDNRNASLTELSAIIEEYIYNDEWESSDEW